MHTLSEDCDLRPAVSFRARPAIPPTAPAADSVITVTREVGHAQIRAAFFVSMISIPAIHTDLNNLCGRCFGIRIAP